MSNSPSMDLLVGSAEEEPGVLPAEQGAQAPRVNGKPLGAGQVARAARQARVVAAGPVALVSRALGVLP